MTDEMPGIKEMGHSDKMIKLNQWKTWN